MRYLIEYKKIGGSEYDFPIKVHKKSETKEKSILNEEIIRSRVDNQMRKITDKIKKKVNEFNKGKPKSEKIDFNKEYEREKKIIREKVIENIRNEEEKKLKDSIFKEIIVYHTSNIKSIKLPGIEELDALNKRVYQIVEYLNEPGVTIEVSEIEFLLVMLDNNLKSSRKKLEELINNVKTENLKKAYNEAIVPLVSFENKYKKASELIISMIKENIVDKVNEFLEMLRTFSNFEASFREKNKRLIDTIRAKDAVGDLFSSEDEIVKNVDNKDEAILLLRRKLEERKEIKQVKEDETKQVIDEDFFM